jgi:hypothetical protein
MKQKVDMNVEDNLTKKLWAIDTTKLSASDNHLYWNCWREQKREKWYRKLKQR